MNNKFLNIVANFLKKRTFEFMGFVLIFLSILLSISFLTYSPSDPSFIYGENNVSVSNYFGIYGSMISDFFATKFWCDFFPIANNNIVLGHKTSLKKRIK